jgi:antitoxin YefM
MGVRFTHKREIVIIQRRGEEEVAMIAASELESLMETAYLLRSPANAERLLTALGRALKGEGELQNIEALRRELGFGFKNTAGIISARVYRRFTLLGRNGSQTGAKRL